MTCPSIFALAVAIATGPAQTQQKPVTSAALAGASTETIPAECEQSQVSNQKRGIWLWVTLVTACVIVSVGGHALVVWLEGTFGLKGPDVRVMPTDWVFIGLLATYVVLLALPYVPGAEIGILLLMLFGAEAALPVYGATVAALLISFLAGRLVPLPRLVGALKRVGLSRVAELVMSARPSELQSTEAGVQADRTSAMLTRILQYRCIALGVLFNTPGNALLGGGGGIALAAGASRLLSFPQFLGTILIAVAPVPAAILIASFFTAN